MSNYTSGEHHFVSVDLLENEPICTLCSAEFLDQEDLDIHIQQVHNVLDVTDRRCQFCNFIYNCVELYATHIRDAHIIHMISCKYCKRLFTEKDKLYRHENKHLVNGKSKLSCLNCPMMFDNKVDLSYHEYGKHSDSEDGVYLNHVYPHLSSLLNMRAETFFEYLNDDTVHTCRRCQLSTPLLNVYLKHLQESNCTSYACNKCNKVFAKRSTLVAHFARHLECHLHIKDEDIKYVCKKCKTPFDQNHIRKHESNCRPMKCEVCDLVFSNVTSYTIHQTEKHPVVVNLHKCNLCLKEFVGKVALEKHIDRTHSEDKEDYRYRCIYCPGLQFKHPKKLLAHFYGQHKDIEPFTCEICNKKFKMRRLFMYHIRLDHKGVGFVEFDENFHVVFTDKQSKRNTDVSTKTEENQETTEKVQDTSVVVEVKHIEEPDKDVTTVNDDYESGNQSGTEAKRNKKENKSSKKVLRKHKRRTPKTVHSDDTDEESWNVSVEAKKKTRRGRPRKQPKHARFTCNICNKYCYTYQNYNNHMSSHSKKELKKCVKCGDSFKSKMQLMEHLQSEHSTSKLTETLKNLLRKKRGETHKPMEYEAIEPMSVRFLKTIKKVPIEVDTVTATLKEATAGISVQNFIENFTPEATDSKKTIKIDCSVTIKPIKEPVIKESIIKMTRFTPKSTPGRIKLAMPVKFKKQYSEPENVKINVVQVIENTTFASNKTEKSYNYVDFSDYDVQDDYYASEPQKEAVPEVAQEVMLEETVETPKNFQIPHKIVIPQLPVSYANVKIAHLKPEAPYYSIVAVDDLIKGKVKPTKASTVKVEEDKAPPKEVSLPDGTKLVQVNPLAHLLKNKGISQLNSGGKRVYYAPKKRKIEDALAKAECAFDLRRKKLKKTVQVEQ